MRRNAKLGLSMALLLSVTLMGCGKNNQPANASEASTVPVQVAVVQKGNVNPNAGLTGKLAPIEEVDVVPKINAKIQNLNVILGQHVDQGDILFALDPTDLEHSFKQSEAALQVSLSSLKQTQTNSTKSIDQANNDVNQSAGNIEELKNALSQAQQALIDAQTNEQRTKLLFDSGAATQAELDKAQTQLLNAQTGLNSAQVKLKNASQSYENAKSMLSLVNQKSDIDVAQANVSQARVNLQNAQEQLANATVTAPISGFVSKVSGATGQMATSQTAVVTLVNTDTLLVKANLSENEVKTVKIGDQVDVFIPAVNQTVKAPIRSISPTMDSQLKAYPMEVAIANDKNEFQAGMVAQVKLPSPDQNQSLVVPRNAVIEDQGKKFVFTVVNDEVKKMEITTGIETSDNSEVKSGLSENDKVVVRGQTLLKEGSKVQVEE
ncbi:MAG TPA: efflux RND transporter periplasmic adaptor subunit [Bacillota bacterium]|nr:efflux RND transporter periplasmic adaptor subunit [Bacillota bacterium]